MDWQNSYHPHLKVISASQVFRFGVFRKPKDYRNRGFLMRELLIRWANRRSVVKPNVAPQKNTE